jgi:hypothetical protein
MVKKTLRTGYEFPGSDGKKYEDDILWDTAQCILVQV